MADTAHHTARGHEISDAPLRPVILTGVVLAVIAAVVLIGSIGIFDYLERTRPLGQENPMSAVKVPVPEMPLLQEHPSIDLEQMRAQEDQILSSYGWVDRNAGVVRIPIERAMELQLQRGFPVRKAKAREEGKR